MIHWFGAQGVYLVAAGLCAVGAVLLIPTLGGVPAVPRPVRGLAAAANTRRQALARSQPLRTAGRAMRDVTGRPTGRRPGPQTPRHDRAADSRREGPGEG